VFLTSLFMLKIRHVRTLVEECSNIYGPRVYAPLAYSVSRHGEHQSPTNRLPTAVSRFAFPRQRLTYAPKMRRACSPISKRARQTPASQQLDAQAVFHLCPLLLCYTYTSLLVAKQLFCRPTPSRGAFGLILILPWRSLLRHVSSFFDKSTRSSKVATVPM
jgi:hypothetical protein